MASSLLTLTAEEKYYAMYTHLSNLKLPPDTEHYLNVLNDISSTLQVDDLSFSTYSSAIEWLDEEELALSRSILRIRYMETELRQHLSSSLHQEQLIDKWSQTLLLSLDVNETVSVLERRKAALSGKAKEYQNELDELMSSIPEAPPLLITDLAAFRKKLKNQEQVLRENRAKVEAFQGVPPNVELARHAVQEARDQQIDMIQLRERLLGKMVDGVN